MKRVPIYEQSSEAAVRQKTGRHSVVAGGEAAGPPSRSAREERRRRRRAHRRAGLNGLRWVLSEALRSVAVAGGVLLVGICWATLEVHVVGSLVPSPGSPCSAEGAAPCRVMRGTNLQAASELLASAPDHADDSPAGHADGRIPARSSPRLDGWRHTRPAAYGSSDSRQEQDRTPWPHQIAAR